MNIQSECDVFILLILFCFYWFLDDVFEDNIIIQGKLVVIGKLGHRRTFDKPSESHVTFRALFAQFTDCIPDCPLIHELGLFCYSDRQKDSFEN